MKELIIHEEVISSSEANSLINSSDRALVSNCYIEDCGYISTINTHVRFLGLYAPECIIVAHDNSLNKVDSSKVKGVRAVSVVSGCAYTGQVLRNKSYGC